MINSEIKSSAFFMQVIATVIVAYLTSLSGFVYSWPSYGIEMLTSTDTNASTSEPITDVQKNLMGSLTNIGALVITPFCGFIIERMGKKYAAMLFGLPFVISWTIILKTKDINMVLFSMFFAGFGVAGQVVSSVYISEIVHDSVRGGLTTATVTGYYVGILISYTLGGRFNYHQLACIYLSLSLLYMGLVMILKESPVVLIRRGKLEDAAKSIAFYRRVSVSAKEVEIEVNNIKKLFETQFELIPQENQISRSLLPMQKLNHLNNKPKSQWQFLCTSQSSKRALMTCVILMTITMLMGSVVLQVYAESLFKDAVPSMSANLCAILMALDFLISSLISAVITDKVGRKTLTTWSCAASGICTTLLGCQLQLQFFPHLFTAALIYIYIFVYTLGAATTPFVLAAEVFLPEVKSLCNSIIMGCVWISTFVTLFLFNPIVSSIGLGPVFYIFSGISLIGAIYSHICLPETKGLPADAIQFLFSKPMRYISASVETMSI